MLRMSVHTVTRTRMPRNPAGKIPYSTVLDLLKS
jgi:hypothetical protein